MAVQAAHRLSASHTGSSARQRVCSHAASEADAGSLTQLQACTVFHGRITATPPRGQLTRGSAAECQLCRRSSLLLAGAALLAAGLPSPAQAAKGASLHSGCRCRAYAAYLLSTTACRPQGHRHVCGQRLERCLPIRVPLRVAGGQREGAGGHAIYYQAQSRHALRAQCQCNFNCRMWRTRTS